MRLIDADKLKDVPMFNGQYDKENANENFIYGIETVMDFINELPTEPVRCRDCKHCFVEGENILYNVCELNHNKVQSDDWFCADGQRLDDK